MNLKTRDTILLLSDNHTTYLGRGLTNLLLYNQKLRHWILGHCKINKSAFILPPLKSTQNRNMKNQ